MQAIADFAADPHRFGGLGDEWFWIDFFQVPEKTSWVVDHAVEVQQRYLAMKAATGKKPSLSVLADEFGKSRPTISAALKLAESGSAAATRRAPRPLTRRP